MTTTTEEPVVYICNECGSQAHLDLGTDHKPTGYARCLTCQMAWDVEGDKVRVERSDEDG